MSPFFVGYFNLIKTVLGTGTIIYPFLISHNGLFMATFITLASCFFSLMGLLIYARLNHKKNLTLSTLSKNTKIQKIVNAVIVFKCISVAISYIKIVGDIVESCAKNFQIPHTKLCFITVSILTIPISTVQKFSKLRFTSLLGVSATLGMIIASLFRYFYIKPEGKIELTKNLDFSKIGSYVFAFTCHQSIFTYQNENVIKLKTVNLAIICSMLSAMVVYITFGLINSHLFIVTDKFFDSLPPDNITLCMQLLFLVTVSFSIPLQLNVAQFYLEIENIGYRYIFVIAVYSAGIFLSLINISLSTIISIVGGTASCLICFIISGLYFILYGDKKPRFMQICAWSTLLFGLCVLLTTLYTSGKTLFATISTFF